MTSNTTRQRAEDTKTVTLTRTQCSRIRYLALFEYACSTLDAAAERNPDSAADYRDRAKVAEEIVRSVAWYPDHVADDLASAIRDERRIRDERDQRSRDEIAARGY